MRCVSIQIFKNFVLSEWKAEFLSTLFTSIKTELTFKIWLRLQLSFTMKPSEANNCLLSRNQQINKLLIKLLLNSNSRHKSALQHKVTVCIFFDPLGCETGQERILLFFAVLRCASHSSVICCRPRSFGNSSPLAGATDFSPPSVSIEYRVRLRYAFQLSVSGVYCIVEGIICFTGSIPLLIHSRVALLLRWEGYPVHRDCVSIRQPADGSIASWHSDNWVSVSGGNKDR